MSKSSCEAAKSAESTILRMARRERELVEWRTAMDDIFYMSSKNVSIKDIEETAKRVNVKHTFVPRSADVLEVEYCDGVMADWFCMELEDFQESADKKFLSEHKIESVFCISYHPRDFSFMLPHIKLLLQEYGGWIGNDGDGFQPCVSMID